MSTLKTAALRGLTGTADSIQLHTSNQSVTFPGNVTCSGTATGFGTANLKMEVGATYVADDGASQHDQQDLVWAVGSGCEEWTITLQGCSQGADGEIRLVLGYGAGPTYSTSYIGGSTYLQDSSQNGFDLDGTVAVQNKEWLAAANSWFGTIKGWRAGSPDTAHIWVMETWLYERASTGGMNWCHFRCNLGAGNGELTSIKLSTQDSAGWDAGSFRYTGILKV